MEIQDTINEIEHISSRIISKKELAKKILDKQKLRIKLGVDPTSPDLHLGHTLVLNILRKFQDLGHLAFLIIGDFTATIGDPSGRQKTRPSITRDEVMHNAKTYTEQAFKILDDKKTEVMYNADWFRKMNYEEIVKVNSYVTLQQMLHRDDFRKRIENNQEIRLHEIQYPIMQAWDSVFIKADVELGAVDQLLNILVGRDIQEKEGLEPQVAVLSPILEGLDGKQKMSKSYDNYVGLDEPSDTMFGKIMSISDELMHKYYQMLLEEKCDSKLHPMEAKKILAERIITKYHGISDAKRAREVFENRFSKSSKDSDEANWPTIHIKDVSKSNIINIVKETYTNSFNIEKSNSEIRRLITGGSIKINGEKINDINSVIDFNKDDILRLDKKRSVKLI